MRILQINTERTWRGGERQTLYCLRGLADAGVDAELLCRAGSPLARKAREMSVPDRQIREVQGQAGALLFLATRGREYDILHAQTAKGQSLAVLAKPFHGRPVVYTRRVDFRPRGATTRLKYGLTDRVTAISGPIRDILADFGVSPVPVITSIAVESPVEPAAVAAVRARLDALAGPGRRVLGTAAQFVPHKDPLTMVEAVRELRQIRKGRDDFVFLHFGDGPLRAEAESLVRRHDLSDVYRFMGFDENLLPWYRVFEAFVMSSREEGLGSSVLDAFLYSVPVVSTDAGGLKECVGDRGLLCPVGDGRCLAQALDAILDGRVDIPDLTRRGRDYALTRHSMARITDQYLDLYRDILATK